METDVAQRYRSRILREMHANQANPFNSPPSSTGSHGTVSPTMTSVFSDPDGESTRRLNEDIARVTAARKLPVNWDAAHRKWPEYFSKPKATTFDNDTNTRPLSANAKENKHPAASAFKFLEEDSTRDVWETSKRKRAEMQARADDESDLSILLAKSPAMALPLHNRRLSPLSKTHVRAPSEPAPLLHKPSIYEALESLRRASSSPRQSDQKHMSGANGSPNMSSAKSSFTAVQPSPMASPNGGANARSFFMPDVSHLGDFVTGTLRFSGSMKNGVPIFVKQGKVHDQQASPAAAKHAAVDSVKVPQDEERIFVSMDMIRDEIVSLQEHHEKVQEYAMNLQQQVERLEAQLKNKGQSPDKGHHSWQTSENHRLRSEIATLQTRLNQATTKLSTSEIANDSISHEKDRVLTRLQEACDDINKLTRKLTHKEKALETSQKLLDSSDQIRHDNDTLRRDLVAANHSRDALELENASLRDDNDKLEGEVETLRSENDRLRQQHQSLLAENKSLRSSKSNLEHDDVLNEDLDEVQHELDVAREELERLRLVSQPLNEEVASLREDNESLVRHNEKYFNDNKMLRRENSGFERSIHDLHEENLKLKEEVSTLKEKMDHYRPTNKANMEPTENTTAGLFMPDITFNTNVSREPTRTKDLPGQTDMTGQSHLTDGDYTESVTNTNHDLNAAQKKASSEQSQKVAFSIPVKPGVLKNTANQGSKRRSSSRQPAKAHFENYSDYEETTGPLSLDTGATQDQAIELSVPVHGIFKPIGSREQTPHPRRTKDIQHTIEADITTGTTKSIHQSTGHALSSDAKRVLDGLCEHSCSNCIVCTRITSHRSSSTELAAGKKRVTVPRPVPVTDRDLSVEDPTMRPAQSPGHALALVIKGLEDESRHLQFELSQLQTKYNSSDKAIGKKERVALAEDIRSLLKSLEVKNDQIYSLYDVLEGQKAAGQAMSEEELEMTVLNITGMSVRDVTDQLTWEGFN